MTDYFSSLLTLMNTCRKVPLQVNFSYHHILLWSLYSELVYDFYMLGTSWAVQFPPVRQPAAQWEKNRSSQILSGGMVKNINIERSPLFLVLQTPNKSFRHSSIQRNFNCSHACVYRVHYIIFWGKEDRGFWLCAFAILVMYRTASIHLGGLWQIPVQDCSTLLYTQW